MANPHEVRYLSLIATAYIQSPDGSVEEDHLQKAYEAVAARLGFEPKSFLDLKVTEREEAEFDARMDVLRQRVKEAKVEATSVRALRMNRTADATDHLMQAHFRLTEAQAHIDVAIEAEGRAR
jgi:hypothetical protein